MAPLTIERIRKALLAAVELCDDGSARGNFMPKSPSPVPPSVPFVPDLSGPSEFVSITSHGAEESEFKLADNTILRIRPVLVEVRRLIGQWAPDGDPVYVTKIGFAISTQAPSHLRKGGPVKKPRKAPARKSAKKR